MDIKNMLDRQQALCKKGILSDGEIKSLVKEWHDVRTEAELNSETVEMEMRAMAEKLRKYNVERLGDLPYPGLPNGRLRVQGNPGDKNGGHGKTDQNVRH